MKIFIPTTKSKGDPVIKIELTSRPEDRTANAKRRLADWYDACAKAKMMGWNKPRVG
jgi:hypothetical protein